MNRSIHENHTIDNCALELNSLKMACNLSIVDVRRALLPPILLHAEKLLEDLDAANKLKDLNAVKMFLDHWGLLVKRYSMDESGQEEALWVILVRKLFVLLRRLSVTFSLQAFLCNQMQSLQEYASSFANADIILRRGCSRRCCNSDLVLR